MYIKDTLKFIKIPDLEITLDGVGTCFIELPRVKLKNVIVACIYRHPHSDRKDFNVNLREIFFFIENVYLVFVSVCVCVSAVYACRCLYSEMKRN